MNIAVTGVSGTFGRAFLDRVLKDALLERVVGISRDELKQSEIAEKYADAPQLRLFLGDVRDEPRMREAFYHCDVVIHAAALKRVDAGAYNPVEMHATNVSGTINVIRAASQAHVKKVLFISSDKAVAPINHYGSTKMMAEQIAISMNTHVHPRGTKVSVLRYGNVLGSRGSVLQLWQRQVAAGQPLTLTDKRMTRFVLTIQHAVELALQAVRQMDGGEIFVPLLPSTKLAALAEAFAPGSEKTYVGVRAGGEKFAEALLNEEEPCRTIQRGDFFIVTPSVHPWRASGWSGTRLADSTRYISDGAFGWATPTQLKTMLAEALR